MQSLLPLCTCMRQNMAKQECFTKSPKCAKSAKYDTETQGPFVLIECVTHKQTHTTDEAPGWAWACYANVYYYIAGKKEDTKFKILPYYKFHWWTIAAKGTRHSLTHYMQLFCVNVIGYKAPILSIAADHLFRCVVIAYDIIINVRASCYYKLSDIYLLYCCSSVVISDRSQSKAIYLASHRLLVCICLFRFFFLENGPTISLKQPKLI